jgi:hypothetical protein
MVSLIDSSGTFQGNCPPQSIPPEGLQVVGSDPPDGMNNPAWDGSQWVAGDPPEEEKLPQFNTAWMAFISSPLYQTLKTNAAASSKVASKLGILSDAYLISERLPNPVWQESLARTFIDLVETSSSEGLSLSADQIQWVKDWIDEYNLNIDISTL